MRDPVRYCYIYCFGSAPESDFLLLVALLLGLLAVRVLRAGQIEDAGFTDCRSDRSRSSDNEVGIFDNLEPVIRRLVALVDCLSNVHGWTSRFRPRLDPASAPFRFGSGRSVRFGAQTDPAQLVCQYRISRCRQGVAVSKPLGSLCVNAGRIAYQAAVTFDCTHP